MPEKDEFGIRVGGRAKSRPSLVQDLSSSFVAQVLVVGGNLLALRLAAGCMTPEGVGEFALVRRVLAFLTPLLLLGLGVGLPRSLGRSSHQNDRASALVVTGFLLGALAAVSACVVVALFPEFMARLLFGSANHVHLVRPLVLLIAGNQVYMLAYSVLRGRLQIRRANLLQVLQIATLPAAAVALLGTRGVETTLFGLGVGACIVASFMALWLLVQSMRSMTRTLWRAALRELASFGLPRVPGDLAFTGLYALGPLLAAHVLDLRAAGMLAIGMSFVAVLSASFTPLGLVLLPRMSLALARNGDAALRERLPALIGASTYGSAFLVVFGATFGNGWLERILGPEFVLDPLGLVFLSVAAGGNVIFVVLRSVLDAAYFRPVNAVHATAALGGLLLAWAVSRVLFPDHPFASVCASIAFSFVLLASLTLAAAARRFRLEAGSGQMLRWVVLQAGLAACVLGSAAIATGNDTLPFMLRQLVLLGVWVVGLRALKLTWPRLLARFLLGRVSRPVASSVPAQATVPVQTHPEQVPLAHATRQNPKDPVQCG